MLANTHFNLFTTSCDVAMKVWALLDVRGRPPTIPCFSYNSKFLIPKNVSLSTIALLIPFLGISPQYLKEIKV